MNDRLSRSEVVGCGESNGSLELAVWSKELLSGRGKSEKGLLASGVVGTFQLTKSILPI